MSLSGLRALTEIFTAKINKIQAMSARAVRGAIALEMGSAFILSRLFTFNFVLLPPKFKLIVRMSP